MNPEIIPNQEPEFKVEGNILKIIYLEGHKNYPGGKEFVFYTETHREPGDVKSKYLLRRLSEALDNAWRKQNEKDVLRKTIELDNRTPNPDENDVLEKLNKDMLQDLARPIADMNPAYDTRIDGIESGTLFTDELKVLGGDWAFAPQFAYGGVIDTRDNFEYALFLDENLDFDYQKGYGLKYRRIVR